MVSAENFTDLFQLRHLSPAAVDMQNKGGGGNARQMISLSGMEAHIWEKAMFSAERLQHVQVFPERD